MSASIRKMLGPAKKRLIDALQEAKTYLETPTDRTNAKILIAKLENYITRTEQLKTKLENIAADDVTEALKLEEEADDYIKLLLDYDDTLIELKLISEQLKLETDMGAELRIRNSFGESTRLNSTNVEQSVRLPKLRMSKFNGNVMNWMEFWDSFESTIDKHPNLRTVDKFTYLISLLQDEAKNCVAGLELTSANYDIAISLLKERYGDKRAIINTHYSALRKIQTCVNQTSKIRNTVDEIEKNLRCLQVLGEDIEHNNFVSLILSKLPREVIIKVEERIGEEELTVTRLRQLLMHILRANERTDLQMGMQKTLMESAHPGFNKSKTQITTGAFYTNDAKCRYCLGAHWSDECSNFNTTEERKAKIKGSCYICLRSGHLLKNCTVKKHCVYCKQLGNHHRSLCSKRYTGSNSVVNKAVSNYKGSSEQNRDAELNLETVLLAKNERVIMQDAKAYLANLNNTETTVIGNILFDGGSQRSYVTEKLAKRLKLKSVGSQTLTVFTFGTNKPTNIKTNTVKLGLRLLNGFLMEMQVNVVPFITGNLGPTKFEPNYTSLPLSCKHLVLANQLTKKTSEFVDLLIGNDYYFDLIEREKIEVKNGLYLINSKLGWIVTGRTGCDVDNEISNLALSCIDSNSLSLEVNEKSDPSIAEEINITKLWDLETIGIRDNPIETDDDVALKLFNDTILFNELTGRYSITWPWIYYPPDLNDNYGLALGRLKTLFNRYFMNILVLNQYDEIIQNQLKDGMIEKVERDSSDNSVIHYMPHHPVMRIVNDKIKTRIVYDGSSRTKKTDKSINDCLYKGPLILEDLCKLLIKFRTYAIGVVADIEKAFLQIELQPSQRNVTRFLWIKDPTNPKIENNLSVFRFTRVAFGLVSSPFILAATIQYHINKFPNKFTWNLKNSFYVDNLVIGVSSEQEAIEFYNETKRLFLKASMNLREWCSNSTNFIHGLPDSDTIKEETVNVLGMCWLIGSDQLSVRCVRTEVRSYTKRTILKSIASIFDPMGLVSPLVLPAKLFLKKLWNVGIDWDTDLEETFRQEWKIIQSTLEEISAVRISRFICELKFEYCELHCFSDASKEAYGTVIYLKIINNTKRPKVNLIFSKNRVTPKNKIITLPRLELLGGLLGTRCLRYVEDSLNLNISKRTLWTDSQCVLHWIKSIKVLPFFVERRIKEIRSYGNLKFSYVPTNENPADWVTRGKTVNELKNSSFWFNGPEWLNERTGLPDFGFKLDIEESSAYEESDCKLVLAVIENVISPSPFEIDIEKFSTLTKLINVTACVLKFIKLVWKPVEKVDILKLKERAKYLWIKHDQKLNFSSLFDDIYNRKYNTLQKQLQIQCENGILRCGGRLSNVDISYNEKHPILLPNKSRFTYLIIKNCHERLMHVGVTHTLAELRKEFWILRGRSEIYRYIKNCLICKKYEGGPYKLPNMPPLPDQRVTQSLPFSFIGLDNFGPLFVKHWSTNENQTTAKTWGCIFTCLATRAIHLELMLNMTALEFLLALRRFISRRGLPQQIISDNAPQYKLVKTTADYAWEEAVTNVDVTEFLNNKTIKWNFISELSPWKGGFYERLISLVKRSLKKSVGKLCLTYTQLETILVEIENLLNTRPLTYVHDEPDNIVLTPAHFLNFHGQQSLMPVLGRIRDEDNFALPRSSIDLLTYWKRGVRHLDQLWTLWRRDYLLSLRERYQNMIKQKRKLSFRVPQLGDIVQIGESLPRGRWKIGKIVELLVSNDGNVRSAKIQIKTGKVLLRSIGHLYPLEIDVTSTDPAAAVINEEIVPGRMRREAAKRADINIKKYFSKFPWECRERELTKKEKA